MTGFFGFAYGYGQRSATGCRGTEYMVWWHGERCTHCCIGGPGCLFRPPILSFSPLPRRQGCGYRLWHISRSSSQGSSSFICHFSSCHLDLEIRISRFSYRPFNLTSLGCSYRLQFYIFGPYLCVCPLRCNPTSYKHTRSAPRKRKKDIGGL